MTRSLPLADTEGSTQVYGGVKVRTKRCRWRPIRLEIRFFRELLSAPTHRIVLAPDDANLRLPRLKPLPRGASSPILCNPSKHLPPFPRPKRYALSIARSNAKD